MAGELTIEKARKVLGLLAEGITDEELEKELEVAKLLKSIYFDQNKNKNVSQREDEKVNL